jgi:hypothetical protein
MSSLATVCIDVAMAFVYYLLTCVECHVLCHSGSVLISTGRATCKQLSQNTSACTASRRYRGPGRQYCSKRRVQTPRCSLRLLGNLRPSVLFSFRMSMTESRSSSVSVSWYLKQIHVPTKLAQLHISGILHTPQRGLAGAAWKPLGGKVTKC